MTKFQQSQAAAIRNDEIKSVNELKSIGAVAEVGFRCYPGKSTNLSTLRCVHGSRLLNSVCLAGGPSPMPALIERVRSVFGSGSLRRASSEKHSDGSYSETFFVITK